MPQTMVTMACLTVGVTATAMMVRLTTEAKKYLAMMIHLSVGVKPTDIMVRSTVGFKDLKLVALAILQHLVGLVVATTECLKMATVDSPLEALILAELLNSILVVIASLAISFGLIMGALHYLQLQSEKLIKGSLFCIIGYLTLFGLLTLLLPARRRRQRCNGDKVLALFFACYIKDFWSDIPFAAVLLRTGVTAYRANIGGKKYCQFCLLL